MREFSIVREVALPPEEVWARLTAWEKHGDHVPFTRVSRTDGGILARTRVGPVTVDDPMELVDVDPPRHFRAVKTGTMLRGEISAWIDPTPTGSRVRWNEWLTVKGVPSLADPLVVHSSRWMYGRLIDRLLRTDAS